MHKDALILLFGPNRHMSLVSVCPGGLNDRRKLALQDISNGPELHTQHWEMCVTQEKSQRRELNSRAPHISDFAPLFSAPEQGTIIGIAGRTESSCANTHRNRIQREREVKERR